MRWNKIKNENEIEKIGENDSPSLWEDRIEEIEKNIFETPWYHINERKSAFLIGLLMQQVKYLSLKNFNTTKPISRLSIILKEKSSKNKLYQIIDLCEKELVKIESSQKRSSPYFGKTILSHLREIIHNNLRSNPLTESSDDLMISFYDGYQFFFNKNKNINEKGKQNGKK